MALIFRESRHAAQAVLVLVIAFKLRLIFEIKRSHTYELSLDEGPQMKGELIVVTLKDAIGERSVRAEHFMTKRIGVLDVDAQYFHAPNVKERAAFAKDKGL